MKSPSRPSPGSAKKKEEGRKQLTEQEIIDDDEEEVMVDDLQAGIPVFYGENESQEFGLQELEEHCKNIEQSLPRSVMLEADDVSVMSLGSCLRQQGEDQNRRLLAPAFDNVEEKREDDDDDEEKEKLMTAQLAQQEGLPSDVSVSSSDASVNSSDVVVKQLEQQLLARHQGQEDVYI